MRRETVNGASSARRRAHAAVPALALAVALAAVLLLAACGSTSAPATSRFDQSADGHTVQAKVGQRLQITLKEDPSSGNKWITLATPGLKIDSSAYKDGARTWILTATRAGAQRFDAVYSDIGSPGTPGLPQRFDLRVIVK